jgi:hypothetical protein
MDLLQLIHLSIKEHLDCFSFLAIMNKKAVNMNGHFFVQTYFSSHLGKYLVV